MRNSETGEYELVMGNRQLLSGFFIVALLFGVAFAMGYIVGRSSTPTQRTQADSSQTAAIAEQHAPPGREAATPPPAEPAKAEPSPPPASTAAPEAAPAEPAAKPADSAATSELAPGTYWQVIAVAQAEAESVRRVLREKNFQVTLSPGTKNLTRVIVGPYGERESLGKAKVELENAGFNPILLKR